MFDIKTFLFLEGAYLILGGVTLLIALFVTTRPFMPEGSVKKGLTGVLLVIAVMIGSHYYITTSRMVGVEKAFNEGEKILCESRMIRKGARFVTIEKSNEWTLKNNNFTSPNYVRPFFTARCIVE